MTPAELPREVRLVAACCAWPPSEARNQRIRAIAAGGIDWKRFHGIVVRQRVTALVLDGVRRSALDVPDAIAQHMATQSEMIARNALAMASEALRLQDAFDAAAVPALFIKGSALAMQAYGNLAIKHAWDIDLLVRQSDVLEAERLLGEAGYYRDVPPADFPQNRFIAWLAFAREALYRHRTHNNMVVELHWRLANNRNQMAHVRADGPSQSVVLSNGRALRTLRDEDQFSYLCLHGAHHGWSRLKWLADLAAWLSGKSPDEIERLYRKAQADGVARGAAQALLLCEELLALPFPPALRAELGRDWATRWLVSIAYDAMLADMLPLQGKDMPLGDFKVEASHFLLAPGVRHWLAELHTKSIGWQDFQNLALPRPFYFLYPLLRLPSWVWRRTARGLKARQTPAARSRGSSS